jgi:hypothetical protein
MSKRVLMAALFALLFFIACPMILSANFTTDVQREFNRYDGVNFWYLVFALGLVGTSYFFGFLLSKKNTL